MPGGPRMGKRLSQAAPRLSMSVVMAGDEPQERKHESTVREFFAEHMKTIVTLVMIFGTILCIVLIVMVHKWRFEGDKLQEIEACLDVAVIGAGISGSYAAWRMRLEPNTHIHLFELSDTAGGRIRTQRFPDYVDSQKQLRAELGAMYYFPQRHRLLNRSIHALRLTPEGYYPPSLDPPTYYIRGSQMTRTDFRAHNRYHLENEEVNKTPEELKRYYTELYLPEAIHHDPLSVKYKDQTSLYNMGYWNFLNNVASREGFNFIQDGAPWRSHVSNGNTALLASVDLNTWEQHYTLSEGMDALPKAMLSQFENSSESHKVHYNKRLVCIQREEWWQQSYYRLMFQHTVTIDGVTTNITKSERHCARKIILAMPPSALKYIKFLGFGDDFPDIEGMVNSVLEPVPAMTAYFMFNKAWWRGQKPDKQEVVTDLPIRRFRYVGSSKKKSNASSSSSRSEDGHLFMVANADMNDALYFAPLLKNTAGYGSVIHSKCNLTMQALQDIKVQIAKVHGFKDASSIPDPVATYIQDWRDYPYEAGWHMWRVGVHWEREAERMRKPFPGEDIYLIGSDLCPGNCQFWAEGALQTVESLLKTHFPESYRSPLMSDFLEGNVETTADTDTSIYS